MPEGAAASGHDDEVVVDEEDIGYKAPEKKSVNQIVGLDEEDEALNKYKKSLLGGAVVSGEAPMEGPLEVSVLKMTFLAEGREPIELDLTGDLSKLKDSSIVIKEGCEYQLNFTFKVGCQIVSGLRFIQHISRKGIPAGKLNLMLGSFGPREVPHEFKTPLDEAPKGALSRAKYHAKCKFTDDDKCVHLEWEWTFKIQSDW